MIWVAGIEQVPDFPLINALDNSEITDLELILLFSNAVPMVEALEFSYCDKLARDNSSAAVHSSNIVADCAFGKPDSNYEKEHCLFISISGLYLSRSTWILGVGHPVSLRRQRVCIHTHKHTYCVEMGHADPALIQSLSVESLKYIFQITLS